MKENGFDCELTLQAAIVWPRDSINVTTSESIKSRIVDIVEDCGFEAYSAETIAILISNMTNASKIIQNANINGVLLHGFDGNICTFIIDTSAHKKSSILAALERLPLEFDIVSETNSVDLEIIGIDSASNERKVALKLKEFGVVSVSFDKSANQATVFYVPEKTTVEQIVGVVTSLGYECSLVQPNSEVLKVQIKGMTCQSCVKTITGVLNDIDGVIKANIDLETESGVIEFIGLQSYEIVNAIEDCGFECTAVNQAFSPALKTTFSNPFLSPTEKESSPLIADHVIELKQMQGQLCKVKVHGMTCSSCVASIENHLLDQNGILNCSVSLSMEEATVEYDSTQLSPEKIAEMIDDMGFEASVNYDKVGLYELQIYGMTCASCSGKIERHFKKVPGVLEASVNLLGQTGTFKVEKQVGVRDLIAEIESLGFNAIIAPKGSNSQLESLSRVKEIKKYRKSFWNAFALVIPIMFIGMVLPKIAPQVAHYQVLVPGLTLADFLVGILTFPVQFIIGWHFYVQTFKSLKHGTYTMDVLVTLGTTLSFGYSVLSIANSISRGGNPLPQVFFETSAMLITFVTLGRYLENLAKAKTSSALAKLIKLAPANCILIEPNGTTKEIPSEYIKTGDLLKILPGSRIPCDGIIEFGQSYVDESLITGEPLPVSKKVGDNAISGTVNGNGALHVRAEKVGSDTTLSRIIKLVSNAQSSKAPIQAVADRVSGHFVPGVIFLAVVTFCSWMFIIKSTGFIPPAFPHDASHIFVCLSMCISVIVVACPCALGLATPTAIMVGTGVGAKMGILIKGGEPLEAAYSITKVVFDKTGTLTIGTMTVHTFEVIGETSLNRSKIIQIIGAVESNSEHPIGKSICEFARTSSEYQVESTQSVPGSGMFALVSGPTGKHSCVVGNIDFVKDNGCTSNIDLRSVERHHQSQGRTVVFMGLDSKVVALVALADQIKSDAPIVVRALKKMGIKVAMITGDQQVTANVIAEMCGISEVHAGITPEGKLRLIKDMQLTDSVAMVGDGVNDSASLAQADMGIAAFGGTDVAVSAASVVLMRPDLRDVVVAIDLSRTIFKRIWINFAFASGYNLAMVPLAMGVGAPWGNNLLILGITLPAMVSAMAMSFSSVSVVLSSLHLQWYRKPVVRADGSLVSSSPITELFKDTPASSTDDLYAPTAQTSNSFRFWPTNLLGMKYTRISESVETV